MATRTVVEMDGDESKLWQAWQRIVQQEAKAATGLTKVGGEARKAAKEERDLTRAAEQLYAKTRTPQEQHNQRLAKAKDLLSRCKIGTATYAEAVRLSGEELKRAGKEGDKAYGPGVLSQVKGLAGALGVTGGVGGAIAAINKGYEVWLQNTREIFTEARKAGNEIIAFAALQEGGTKAEHVKRAADLGAKYGVLNRGEAFNTVQALQSVHGGDFEAGLRASETVFQAAQLGIPTARGRELEVLGASQKQKEGQALRRAYVAGQASGRDPDILAGGAAGFKFFPDKDFANAVAAIVSESVKPDQLPTFLKQAGIGLAKTGPAQKRFVELGLGDATRQEKLKALYKMGIDTEEELKEFGFNEQRQREALLAMVPNYPQIERIQKIIKDRAKPGLFTKERRAVEKELPQLRTSREIDLLTTLFRNETAFGAASKPALEVTKEKALRGLAMKRLGYEQGLFFDLIEGGEGDTPPSASRWDVARAWFGGHDVNMIDLEMGRMKRAIESGQRPATTPWTWQQERLGEFTPKPPALPPAPPDSAITEIVRESGAFAQRLPGQFIPQPVGATSQSGPGQQPPGDLARVERLLEEGNRQRAQIGQATENQKAGGPTLAKPDEDR